MVVYTAYEPPSPPQDRIDRAASVEFVRDGFSVFAAIAPPIWLLAHGLWLEFLGYIVLAAGMIFAMDAVGLGETWELVVIVAIHIWFAFEAAGLRRWNFERRKWTCLGTVTGTSLLDCERRFFDSWLPALTSVPQD